MILLAIDRKNKQSIFMQIVDGLKELIEAGVLKPGMKLPSTRELAEKHEVNRSTVYRAYEELWALGYVESSPGSYTRVRSRTKRVTGDNSHSRGIIPWDKVTSRPSRVVHAINLSYRPEPGMENSDDIINFGRLDMDQRLFPKDEFRKSLNNALFESDPEIFGYCDYRGYDPLRECIAGRLGIHGISAIKDEILITNGSQNGLELVLRMLVVPGSKVLLESPTYANMFPLLRLYNAEIINIPMTPMGLDLDYLERVLKREKASFLYTMPNFQNPTGSTTNQLHRENLLGICEANKVPIIEDGFEEEMKYYGKVAMPIKSMDKNKIVIYLGTFSKVLIPGVRIGWAVAEKECINRLVSIKRFADISSNSIGQIALYEFCKKGLYDLHIKKMHRFFRKRMNVILFELKKNLTIKDVTWNEPCGGYLIWIDCHNCNLGTREMVRLFYSHGIIVSPGEFYFETPPDHQCFRLSIATLDEEEIKQGVQRLSFALNELYN